jgi:predicted RND superfamily exporter protein
LALVATTVACTWLTAARLRVDTDLSTLFPATGDAATLATWTRAFGGREPALVLVRGDKVDDVAKAAEAIADSLRKAPSIERVIDRVPRSSLPSDPTLAWIYAGPQARARLASIVTAQGMRDRLAETRALLLSPAVGDDVETWLARDPLRLAQVPWERNAPEVLPGLRDAPGGLFEGDEGRARLIVAEPRGSAFDSASARALVADVERAEAEAMRPGVTMELAGGHAIAFATESMLRHDLELSGVVSSLLASVAFVLTFRRVRALIAVLPPLVLGTLWTTGLAALSPSGLDALAIAFAAVVVGVGVDTGIHVYSALLDARREGLGPHDAAVAARARTWRPTMVAATVAAFAFGSLGLGSLHAMRELGLLCAAGELLTAVAILLVTPEIGSWLERGPSPAVPQALWLEPFAWATATRRRALVALMICAAPGAAVALLGWPKPADALVAIRPESMPPFEAEQHIRDVFGGSRDQWIVLTQDQDAEGARARADHVAEALASLPANENGTLDGFDALGTLAPARSTLAARLSARDALDLPARRAMLEGALRDAGFDIEACAPALDAFARPAPLSTVTIPDSNGDLAWLFWRHLAQDGGRTLVATYARPGKAPDALSRMRTIVMAADSKSELTGLASIEGILRRTLARDLLVVGGVALLLVALGMRVALRSGRGALVALATLACEMGAIGLFMRVFGVRWHVYDALVVPVLFGVTIDESMFLLHAAGNGTIDAALRKQGPLVAATALTTAAGFAALVACRYPGLRDLGAVGAAGVLAGLVAALIVVPGALRLLGPLAAPVARGPSRPYVP